MCQLCLNDLRKECAYVGELDDTMSMRLFKSSLVNEGQAVNEVAPGWIVNATKICHRHIRVVASFVIVQVWNLAAKANATVG